MNQSRSEQSWTFFYLLLALIVAMPFVLADRGWMWAYFGAAFFFLLAAWFSLRTYRRFPVPDSLRRNSTCLILGIGALTYLLLKTIPIWPLTIAEVLNPGIVEIYRFAEIAGWNDSGRYALSIDVGPGIREFLRTASYFALLILVLVLVRTRTQARILAYVMLSIVFLVGLWGLVDYLAVQLGKGRASGLFTNANLFAGFIEPGLGLAAGLLYAEQERTRAFGWRGRLVGIIDWLMSWRAKFFLVFVVLLGALFASGSRGGTFSIILALLLSATVLVRQQPGASGSKRFIAVLILLSGVSVTWLGADAVMDRLGEGQLESSARLSYYRSALQMASEYPLFGMGGGSWRHAYSQYRDTELSPADLPLHAHNDHLQMLAEHGVIGYLLFGSFLVVALWSLIKTLQARHDRFVRGITFGSLAATLSLLFHAFTDNNFQVTVTMAYFFAILGLGLAAARLPSARGRSSST